MTRGTGGSAGNGAGASNGQFGPSERGGGRGSDRPIAKLGRERAAAHAEEKREEQAGPRNKRIKRGGERFRPRRSFELRKCLNIYLNSEMELNSIQTLI